MSMKPGDRVRPAPSMTVAPDGGSKIGGPQIGWPAAVARPRMEPFGKERAVPESRAALGEFVQHESVGSFDDGFRHAPETLLVVGQVERLDGLPDEVDRKPGT